MEVPDLHECDSAWISPFEFNILLMKLEILDEYEFEASSDWYDRMHVDTCAQIGGGC